MTDAATDRLDRAIAEAFAANRDYYRVVFNTESSQVLGPPARPEDVDWLEAQLGWRLPPSYREFLLRHDGWRHFRADAHLLSTRQREEPGMKAHIAEFRELTHESTAFIILAGEASTTLGYLDPGTVRPDGEMDAVEYNYSDGELGRYPVFTALLEAWAATLRRLIARETGQGPAARVEE